MSYDLRFAIKIEGADGAFWDIGYPEHDSPTYNLGEMFRACMGWNFNQGEYYKVDEIRPYIKKGIVELVNNKEQYYKYNAHNGWGNTNNALECLVSISKWITEFEEEHEDIPLSCIYMAW